MGIGKKYRRALCPMGRCLKATDLGGKGTHLPAAMLLHQIEFRFLHGSALREADGKKWVAQTGDAWCDETGLTTEQYRDAIARLKALHLIEVERRHLNGNTKFPPITHLRLTYVPTKAGGPPHTEYTGHLAATVPGHLAASPTGPNGLAKGTHTHVPCEKGDETSGPQGGEEISDHQLEKGGKKGNESGKDSPPPPQPVSKLREHWYSALQTRGHEVHPDPADLGKLKKVVEVCQPNDIEPAVLLTRVVDTWGKQGGFDRYAYDVLGQEAFNPPTVPHLGYVAKHRTALPGFMALKPKVSGASFIWGVKAK